MNVKLLIIILVAIIAIIAIVYQAIKISKTTPLSLTVVLSLIVDDLVKAISVSQQLVKLSGDIPALEAALVGIISTYLTTVTVLTDPEKKFLTDNIDTVIPFIIAELIKLGVVKTNAANIAKYSVIRGSLKTSSNAIHSDIRLSVATESDILSLLPPVFDQGTEGACTGNSGSTAVSMAIGKPTVILSRQYLYQNERKLEHVDLTVDAGAQMVSIGTAAIEFGVCKESLFTYIPENLSATPSAEAIADALNYKPKSSRQVASLTAVKQIIATSKLPVLLGMSVYASFESAEVAKTGIVPMPTRGDELQGGHAVLIVGYKDTPIKLGIIETVARVFGKPISLKSTGYVIVRNSWGASWGLNGYCHIPYEYIKSYGYDMYVIQ